MKRKENLKSKKSEKEKEEEFTNLAAILTSIEIVNQLQIYGKRTRVLFTSR